VNLALLGMEQDSGAVPVMPLMWAAPHG
jgi:hypothetical protein